MHVNASENNNKAGCVSVGHDHYFPQGYLAMTLEKYVDTLSEYIAQKPYVKLQQVETESPVECGDEINDYRVEVAECNP